MAVHLQRLLHTVLWICACSCLFGIPVYANGFTLVPPVAADGDQAPSADDALHLIYSNAALVSRPVTLVSTVRFDQDWDSENDSPILLLGLNHIPAGIPTALAIAWIKDTNSWVPRWQLVLAGTLRMGKSKQQLNNPALSNATALANVEPLSGHTYATALGYNPVNGSLSYSVTDETTGKCIYRSDEEVASTELPLHAASGVVSQNSMVTSTVSVDSINVYNEYIPVSSTWEIGVGTAGDRAVTRLFTGEEPGYMQLEVPQGFAGVFRLTLQHDTQLVTLASIRPTQPSTTIDLPVGDLPTGKSMLKLEYIADGQTWISSTQDIVVGSVSVEFAGLAIDRTTHAITIPFGVKSNKQYNAFPVNIEAFISQLEWDGSNRIYRNKLVSRRLVYAGAIDAGPVPTANPTPIQVAIPAEPGLWEIKLVATSDTGIAVKTTGERQLFHTYAPVALVPNQPFTIAVLPDTQLYTRTDKPIFMRMTQWIAENAVAKNIGLVLHMGDITEQNRPWEWNIATESLQLLDGVSPYVLAVGNHDLLRPEDGYTVNDYDGSLINAYFPPSRFSALQGTFAPNRIENSYYSFNFNGQDYLVLSLEYAARPQVMVWANDIVTTHPNHKVIVVTHDYLNSMGNRDISGDYIWWNFIRLHKNILMLLCGHIPTDTVPYVISKGVNNNLVYQLLFDYQGEANGGNGYIGLLEFTPDNTINVRVYSPYLGVFKSDRNMFFSSDYKIMVEEGKVVEY